MSEQRQSGVRPFVWTIAVLLTPYVLLGALVPPTGETPYSDDFDYSATAWHLSETGKLCLSDWPTTMLAGHVAWGALFCKLGGNNYLMLRLSMFALSALAAVSLYSWARKAGHGRGFASWCGVTFALCPLAVSLTYSFLTDVTGAALATLLVVLSQGLLNSSSKLPWVGYGLLGGLAYLSRQTASIPYLVVCAVIGWECLRRRASWQFLVLLLMPFALTVLGYKQWLAYVHGVPSHHKLVFLQLGTPLQLAERLSRLTAVLGLHLAPAAVLVAVVGARPGWRSRWTSGAAAAVAIFGLSWLATGDWPRAYLGEVFDVGLRSTEMPGSGAPESLRSPVWQVGARTWSAFHVTTGILSTIAAAALIPFGVRHWRPTRTWAGAPAGVPSVAKLSFLMTAGLLMFTLSFMDRYVLGCIPLALLALAEMVPPAESGRRGVLASAWAATIGVGLLSVIGIQDGMQRSRTFWATASQLHALGLKPDEIDGGLAYAGFYRYNTLYRGSRNAGPHLDTLSPEIRSVIIAAYSPWSILSNRAVQISFDESPGYRVVARQRFRSWFRTGDVLVLVRDDVQLETLPPPFREWLGANSA